MAHRGNRLVCDCIRCQLGRIEDKLDTFLALATTPENSEEYRRLTAELQAGRRKLAGAVDAATTTTQGR